MERPKKKATINDAATGFFHVQNSCTESRNPGCKKNGRDVMKKSHRLDEDEDEDEYEDEDDDDDDDDDDEDEDEDDDDDEDKDDDDDDDDDDDNTS